MTTDTLTEAQLREDLVTCSKILVMREVLDYSGHLSARVPGTDRILIQPRDFSRAGLAPEDLLVVNHEGEVIEGNGTPPAETAIHTGVYRARKDINMVCHGHPLLSTTFSMTDAAYLPMRHFAFKHAAGLAVHPDVTHITKREQGDAVGKTLGDADACLLRSHGTVVVARTMPELLMDCLDLEENARTLIAARQIGGNILPLTADEVEALRKSYGGLGHRPKKLWNHCVTLAKAAGVL